MQDKSYLMIPGPTPVPPTVVAAMTAPMIGHRSEDFQVLHKDIITKLQKIFQTQNEIYILTSSGTGGMESAVANTVSPGDKVLTLVGGKFGERWSELTKQYGAEVIEVNFEWGTCVDPQVVQEKLAANPDIKVVFATQNETSTGVTNDIESIGKIVAQTSALFVVDGVSGVGGIEIKVDEWHVDILTTGSQKSLMLPPGLAIQSISDKAWKVIEANKSPRYYFNLLKARKQYPKWNTAYTPAVSLFVGLNASLDMMLAEGLDNVYARHKLLREATRAAIRALGLKLMADESYASPVITSVYAPEGIGADDIRKVLNNEYNITFAGGQAKLKNKIFRIAHMGFADQMNVLIAISGLEMALQKVGYPVELGAGVRAAQQVFLGV
ncbi:pyridoxal-phosphate-dependent aminotransferase family protein [Desulfoscipio gibsoniae]|uniref:Serine-pyruvate aminotransferase/archaeal aspartate aminotransferase n=1 Tax=Desulfoscipio gibsoniae DSM 7213 TaxID=767817 RepID=R4KGK0_9FIRM|nr:alanine--glyoxylate aminotransferase family protein [Desulfoscipio gibsoniae]AGK99639.1 serine-pyruvate aminotransferase/archaeal aspartate aminotransferase [Desulfoscipio gibsoniae DSM 7213]